MAIEEPLLPGNVNQGQHIAPKKAKGVKVARDRAQYVRQQKGHSWILHWLVLGIFTVWIVPIYYSFSPNHYWHL